MTLAMACQSAKEQKQSEQQQSSMQETPREVTTTTYAPGTRLMERVVGPIGSIRNIDELNYAVDHFWDGFDFECGERVVEYNTMDICQAFVDYTYILHAAHDYTPLSRLIMRAEASREVLDLFTSISDMVLHDPNSPLRNDEMYIYILERLVESPLLDEYDRLVPEHDLHMVKQNRIGHKANDVVYTLKDGTTGHLHDIDADYTILMFNNPDCPTCREIIDEIGASPMLNELQELGRLKVIALYPDADLEAWHRYHSQMPRRWIVSYDNGCIIDKSDLYDLRAIPSLYLLDGDKRVMIKDGIDVAYIEDVIAMAESQM